MTKATTTEVPKTSKKRVATRGEHAKDIVIAILITAVIAFIGGMVFANKQDAEVKNAVSAAQAIASPKVEAVAPTSK